MSQLYILFLSTALCSVPVHISVRSVPVHISVRSVPLHSWTDEADCILRRAVAVFSSRMAPRDLRLTIHTLLHWIFVDDDGGQMGRGQVSEQSVE